MKQIKITLLKKLLNRQNEFCLKELVTNMSTTQEIILEIKESFI